MDPILGNTGKLADLGVSRAKGGLVAARRRYLLETWGQVTLERVIERTPEPARRHLLNPPSTFVWVPMEEMVAIDRQIIEGPMRGDVSKMQRFGEVIAEYDLNTLYKAFFRVGSPSFIIRSMALVYRAYLKPGSMTTEQIEPTHTRVTMSGVVHPRYFCEWGIAGWLSAAIELSGGRDTRATHTTCVHDGDPACTWDVRWRAT